MNAGLCFACANPASAERDVRGLQRRAEQAAADIMKRQRNEDKRAHSVAARRNFITHASRKV